MKIQKIHEDSRGAIYRIMVHNKEYVIIETKKGFTRGGDFHKSTQHDIVLKGEILWQETFDGVAEAQATLKEGESTSVAAGIPHMYTSITDTIVLEWLEGSFEKQYYEPYRKIIQEEIDNVE